MTVAVGVIGIVLAACGLFAIVSDRWGDQDVSDARIEFLRRHRLESPRSSSREQLTFWWDAVPEAVRQASVVSGTESNILPTDYAGAQTCRKCHKKNYESWSRHSHRWMNALAGESTVKGDFSGERSISYMGGKAHFYRERGEYRMSLERDDLRQVFTITQTIGSRFFQYYIGRLIQGPVSREHPLFSIDHVLLFGYWIPENEWVPAVHVSEELPDDTRRDPFAVPVHDDPRYAPYASACNKCHTTFPFGDDIMRKPDVLGRYAPFRFHLLTSEYISKAHPDLLRSHQYPSDFSNEAIADLHDVVYGLTAPDHAVTLGISCEACHLGCKDHVDGKLRRPKFIPESSSVFIETNGKRLDSGRSHANVNWACARCHAGARPEFSAGMSTWNSIEYTDAVLGGCYSKLTCIHCHNPHETIGPRWKPTPLQDDAVCLSCHQHLEPAEARSRHTHHLADSNGSRCMNCHMPRLNEGLQEVVRTHMIYSPNRSDMIEANHPNACNLCHTDKTIDWTLTHLDDWYGDSFSPEKIRRNYPNRTLSAAVGWTKSDEEAVRLVAVDSLIRTRARSVLPEIIQALDDPFLINRQFAAKGLERWLGCRLSDFGYRFYMTPEERREPLQAIQEFVQTWQREFESAPPATSK
ncbi:MAG: multiheme c-type cytochrome [Fuerstiella sp.]|nr:hypothetical protein [Fuerstiella sp.]